MKEIKFRGFHPCSDGGETIILDGEEIRGRWVCGDFCKPCNIITEEIGYDKELMQDGVPVIGDYKVIRETVGMFACRDSDGNDVFEWDNVAAGDGSIGEVEYDSDMLAFMWNDKYTDTKFYLCDVDLPVVVGKRKVFESFKDEK